MTEPKEQSNPVAVFKREERYIVLKMKRLSQKSITHIKRTYGEALVNCLVVESGWPEYEPTWDAIQDRVTGVERTPSVADNAVAAIALMKAVEACRAVGKDWAFAGCTAEHSAAVYLEEAILALIPADHMQALRELMVEVAKAAYSDSGYIFAQHHAEDEQEMLHEIVDRILAEKGLA